MTMTLLGVDLVKAIGLVAACCTTLAFVPQALRAVRTRQTKDISLLTFLMLVIGILLWLTYGLLIGDLPLILSNTITLVLASAILATKLRYG